MTDRRSSSAVLRLFIALLLATIGLQAVPSGDLSIERDQGSAFSASTLDSAVARQLDRVEIETVAQPMLPPPDSVITSVAITSAGPGWHAKLDPELPVFAVASPPYLPRPPPSA